MMSAIGQILRRNGMTQQQLADALGVSKGYVSELVSGKKNPSTPMLRRIADALNATVDDILTEGPVSDAAGPAGFSEPQAELSPAPESPSLRQLVKLLAPGSAHVQAYRAGRAFPAFAILPGDLLLIGTPPTVRDGDLVIATLSNGQPHHGVTVLRQRMGDRLVPPPQGRIDGEEAMSHGILGTVIAAIRSPATTPELS